MKRLAALAAVLLPAAALAQPAPQDRAGVRRAPVQRVAPAPAPGYGPAQARGAVCIPWCPQDDTPCDPPAFKQADGRCFNQ